MDFIFLLFSILKNFVKIWVLLVINGIYVMKVIFNEYLSLKKFVFEVSCCILCCLMYMSY